MTGENLAAAMSGTVDVERVVLHTDEGSHYKRLPPREGQHFTVNHSAGEYVRGDVSTNQAENFFSQLKRSIDGTHHHVSVPHLGRYLAEFAFRHTHRKDTDTERMARIVGQTHGRRLTYRQPACSD